jgi:hypothetical protein
MAGSVCKDVPCPINPGMQATGATGNVAVIPRSFEISLLANAHVVDVQRLSHGI